MEIGLLNLSGGESEGGVGALMLPEIFLQKVTQCVRGGRIMIEDIEHAE
jgi:hypothetical protein